MSRKRKAELYEIISKRTSSGVAAEHEGALDNTINSAYAPRSFVATHSRRDVVFSIDGAFIIFVVCLMLIGTAFYIGYQRGSIEARAGFVDSSNASVRNISGDEIKLVEETPTGSGNLELPMNKNYTLKIYTLKRTPGNFKRLKTLRKQLLSSELLASSEVGVFIYDEGAGPYYNMSVGLFESDEDELLSSLLSYLKSYAGSNGAPLYPNTSIERIDDLGRPVL